MTKKMKLMVCFSGLSLSLSALATTEPLLIHNPQESRNFYCTDKRGDFADSPMIEEICRITNQERTKRKLKALVLDSELSEVAQKHAEDMAKRDFFSHQNPDGESPFDRIQEAQIPYRAAAENISMGYKTPAAAMKGWMNSSGHRHNILGSRYGKIGIGFYQNYWVQVFTN